MKLKLKYGANFSKTNEIPVFSITDSLKKGKISISTKKKYGHRKIKSIEFNFTRNGIPYGKVEQGGKKSRTIDFTNLPGNWGVEVTVKQKWRVPGPVLLAVIQRKKTTKISGVFRVVDNTSEAKSAKPKGQGGIITDIPSKIFSRFSSTIDNIENNVITTTKAVNEDLPEDFTPKTYEQSSNWSIRYNKTDYRNLNTLIDFGNNEKSVIVNSKVDAETIRIEPYSIILKTYSPISKNIRTKQNVSIVKEMVEPIRERIKLYPFDEAELGEPILRQPNDSSVEYINNARTEEKSLADLYTSDNFLSGSIYNKVLSGSNSANINVDYNDYGNYSMFGSTRKRLENFWSKLERLEYYSKESGSLAVKLASTASVFDSEIVKNEELKNNIINNFDHYEKYLYYESSSANSSSFGEEYDTSWPKENSSKPYNVLSVTSSAAVTWYNNNVISASNYDQSNPNRLINLVPEYLKGHHITSTNFSTATESYYRHQYYSQDTDNKPFLDFLDMVGHYYDNIWIYIKAFEDTYDRREDLKKGLSKDLVWAVSNAFGWKQPSGKELIDLHRYVKGYQLSGSATSSTYTVYSTETEKNIEREIWGRVLSSMPYILKRKGTKESIQALVNAYGIPPTILKIKEYGGPDVKEYQPTFDIQQRFTKALDFKGSQYILSQWKEASGSLRTPDTIEFRFKAASGSNQVLLAKNDDFVVRLKETSSIDDNKGRVEFLISSSLGTGSISSSEFPVYNNEFWAVGISRELNSGTAQRTVEFNTTESLKYNLYVKQYESGRSKILYESATSMTLSGSTAGTGLTSSLLNGQWTASSDIYWGSTGSFTDMGVEFTGSLQELRYWNAPLTESAFNNHTGAPKAINGNHASASFTDLIYRLRLDENRSLASEKDLRNVVPDQLTFAHTSSAFQTGSAVGFTANTYSNIEQEEKALVPNVGMNRQTNAKVRIEKSWIPSGSGLSVDYRTEESSYDTSPLDSNKVGLFFSPTDVVNRDIIESLADLDFDQEIGDPRDEQELFYRGLNKLAESYFQKYTGTNNFWDYMRLVKYYDQAIYEQVKKVMPARTKFSFGLLVEPNILERPKEVISKSPSIDNLLVQGEINVGLLEATQSYRRPVISVTSSRDDYFGVVSESFFHEPSFYLIGSASLSSSLNDNRYTDSFVRVEKTGSLLEGVKLPDVLFNEAVHPFISSSRKNDIFEEREIFYTSSAAVGTAGAGSIREELAPLSSSAFHAYSSSFKKTDYNPLADYFTGYRRSVYDGVKNTIDTTSDKELPIIVQTSSPTAVVSKQAGSGKKLEVIRKK